MDAFVKKLKNERSVFLKKLKVLFVGESWTVMVTHIKGADQFTQTFYEEGVKWIKAALESEDIEFIHMPCHVAMYSFPTTVSEMEKYDCIIFSDIGYNSIMLHPDTSQRCLRTPNRLECLKQYVNGGGGFLMIGGYMSFSGIEAKAHYKGTLVEEILPVNLLESDDRVEIPQGENPKVASRHTVLEGIDQDFPHFLSYNKLLPKEGSETILSFKQDPLLVLWDCGKGRTAAFAADTAPHGAPPAFLDWKYFPLFWGNLVRWLCKE